MSFQNEPTGPDFLADVTAGSPPGAVRLFLWMGGWVVVGLFTLVGLLTVFAEYHKRLDDRFVRDGVEARARVVDGIARGQLNVDGSVTYRYFAELEFETQTGRPARVEQQVSLETLRGLSPGALVSVRYLPDNPSDLRWARGADYADGRGAARAALGFGGLGLLLLWLLGRRAVSAELARREGAQEKAEVMGLRRSFWCGVKGQRYRLIWRDAGGVEQASLLHRKRDLMDVAERR